MPPISAEEKLEASLEKAEAGDLSPRTGAALLLVKVDSLEAGLVFKRTFGLYQKAAQAVFVTAQYRLLHACRISMVALLLALQVQLSLPAWAQTQTQTQTQTRSVSASVSSDSLRQELEENTRKLLRVLVEMERYNLNYRLNVANQGLRKGWRYFLTQETNPVLTGAGYIVGTAERCGHFQRPGKLARIYLENGNYLTFTGQIIGASGSAAEFGINCFHEAEARKHGYSPAAARKKVLSSVHQVEALLAERHQQTDQLTALAVLPRYVEMARVEESVLVDIRNLSLSEFQAFHSNARGFLAFQQTLYLLDIARNVCGAMGSHCGWSGLQTGDRHYNESAGILGDASGIITMLNPLVSRGAGKVVGKYEKHYVRACFDGAQEGDIEKLERDLSVLRQVANSPDLQGSDLPVLRTALYSEDEDGVRRQVAVTTRERRASLSVAAENIGSGFFIGIDKVAAGILFNVAGDRYVKKSRRSNVLLGSANIVGLVGNAYAACENTRIQVKRQISENKLSREGQLPRQVIRARLAKLDAMERQL